MSLTDEAHAKSISQHPVKSAFSHLALALRDGGINQSLPKEALHVFCVGHYITLVIIVHDLIGKKGKNAKHKDLLDMLFQRVQSEVKRGSCRDHPISSSHFGVMDKSRATGEQRKGNMHVLLLCVNTFQGIELLKPFLERAGITISEMSNAISLLLAYDQWTSGRCIPRVEVENAMPAVEELVTSLQHALPKRVVKKKRGAKKSQKRQRASTPNQSEQRTIPNSQTTHSQIVNDSNLDEDDEPGSNGWHTPKTHALFHFPRNIQNFGSGTCFDGAAGEQHHIEFVKKLGYNTNRVVSKFAEQIGKRSAEVDDIR